NNLVYHYSSHNILLHAEFLLHFFFQAEDGIRDGHVTGVQTCALPICTVTQDTARTLLTLRIMVAARNSPVVSGLANRFIRLRDQISSRKEIVIPCWARNSTSHRISAPRKNRTKFGSAALNCAR